MGIRVPDTVALVTSLGIGSPAICFSIVAFHNYAHPLAVKMPDEEWVKEETMYSDQPTA